MYLNLDGRWQLDIEGQESREIMVPGLVGDPRLIDEKPLLFSCWVNLPEGDYSCATLYLKGARFTPEVFVDGESMGRCEGGMGPIRMPIHHESIRPGQQFRLSVKLFPLSDVDPDDASNVPDADRWRSNLSSCLWDSVLLRLHGDSQLSRLIPFAEPEKDRISVSWQIDRDDPDILEDILIEVTDLSGSVILKHPVEQAAVRGRTRFYLHGELKQWTPRHPHLYRLNAYLLRDGKQIDQRSMNLGLRRFELDETGKGFLLNGQPKRLRAGSVVWHRWMRDPEARELAYDLEWFTENVIKRLKSHGANTLRFHLGLPPESILDLCDKHGLMVQTEWIFFHGVNASKESMLRQWEAWFDLVHRHPSCVLSHAWNESDGHDLTDAFAALEEMSQQYPPMILSHQDVDHPHKYWWSLFENLGLYFDDADEFDRAVMVDEFGGNYLDGEGKPGAYPSVEGSLQRFLGPDHTREERLDLQCLSNARMAEYWRGIGVAGFSPFCLLGSPEDGNHHFTGPLREANPKPVWGALTAAYSPSVILLQMWDRHLSPGQEYPFSLCFQNDTHEDQTLVGRLELNHLQRRLGKAHELVYEETISVPVNAHSSSKEQLYVTLPQESGWYEAKMQLLNPDPRIKHPVVSSWRFCIHPLQVPESFSELCVVVSQEDEELSKFLQELGVLVVEQPLEGGARIWAGGKGLWAAMRRNPGLIQEMDAFLSAGGSILMLDVGEGDYGPYYRNDPQALKSMDGVPKFEVKDIPSLPLPGGVSLDLETVAEPESCVHPTVAGKRLWDGLDKTGAWLWNGLRGGLVAPAERMSLSGIGAEAFVDQWVAKGAEAMSIREDRCWAYQLEGHYAFSEKHDPKVAKKLYDEVMFLAADAPALAQFMKAGAEVEVLNLGQAYQEASQTSETTVTMLASCGRDLVRTPLIGLQHQDWTGKLMISQLITQGRLDRHIQTNGDFYALRYDPAAAQLVINMLADLQAT